MKHKLVSALVVMSMFFTMVLNAAAAPISAEPVSNLYTGHTGSTTEVEPQAVPALVGAFLLGVAASLVANVAYDYAKHKNWVWGEAPQLLDVRAEAAFDY